MTTGRFSCGPMARHGGVVARAIRQYRVTASLKGFEAVAQDNAPVSVNQVTAVNIALQVGSVNEEVTVSSSAEIIDPDNSTVGQLITTKPSIACTGGQVTDLVQLSAGVTPPTARQTPAIRRRSTTSQAADLESMSPPTASTGPSSARSITSSTAARWASPKTTSPPSSPPSPVQQCAKVPGHKSADEKKDKCMYGQENSLQYVCALDTSMVRKEG